MDSVEKLTLFLETDGYLASFRNVFRGDMMVRFVPGNEDAYDFSKMFVLKRMIIKWRIEKEFDFKLRWKKFIMLSGSIEGIL